MKILAIGKNYDLHIREMKSERPDEPVIFFKPDTALLKNNDPFYYPDFSNDIHHEVELVIKIDKEGKYIDEAFAHKYYSTIGIGIDFTARDLQAKAKEKGLPWALSKGFNSSAPVSDFFPKEDFVDLANLDFHLEKNGKVVQKGNSSQMIYTFDQIIAYLSRFITLKKGDLIFTGTPEGVGPIQKGDRLSAFLVDKKVMEFDIK